MKFIAFLFSLLLLVGASFGQNQNATTRVQDYVFQNTSNSVPLTVVKPGTQSSNFFEFYRGSNLELAIPGTNTVSGLKQNLGIQSGTATNGANLTVTNTFTTAFSATPIVVASSGSTNGGVSVASITTSNCIFGAAATNRTFTWIAVGAP